MGCSRFAIITITLLLSTTVQANALPKFLVILDPGHGGDDTGAIRHKIAEKNITLSIAKKALKSLKERGISAILTRTRDEFVGLDRRTEIANKAAPRAQTSVFVSIHANSSDESRSSGIETYVFNAATNQASRRLADLENGKRFSQGHGTIDLILSDLATTANFTESVDLACTIQKTVVNGLTSGRNPVRDRGTRQALFYVLMQTQMPGVLFEPGFISNPKELTNLSDPRYQDLLAKRLVDGIIKWKIRYNTRSANSSKVSAIAKSVDTPPCQIH